MDRNSAEFKRVVEAARENLNVGDQLAPIFYVGNEKEMDLVMTPFTDDGPSKTNAANQVRKIAQKMDASFVVFVAESWTIPTEYGEDFLKNRAKYGNVSNHPKAYEVVLFMIETSEGQSLARATITKMDDGKRELGPLEWIEQTSSEGRFSNLLRKPKAPKEAQQAD